MSNRGVNTTLESPPGPAGLRGSHANNFRPAPRIAHRGYSLHEDVDDGTPNPAPAWTHRAGAEIRADLIRTGALLPWVEGRVLEFCVHPVTGLTHLQDRPYPTLRLLGCPAERPKGWRRSAEVDR